MSDKNKERTFIAIKPDGVQRGLIAKIIKQFEQRGYKLVAMKMVKVSEQHLEVKIAYVILLFLSLLKIVRGIKEIKVYGYLFLFEFFSSTSHCRYDNEI